MAVDLSDYVETVRREVAPPGSTTFDTVSDDVFTGYLADAFWEVKLDGFMEPFACDSAGIVLPINDAQVQAGLSSYTPSDYDATVDIGREQIALICLYAGIKIIRNRLIEQPAKTRAKAGPVEFEQDYSANLLVEMLKELQSVKNRLLYLKTFNQDVALVDAFSARSTSAASYSGYLYDWYAGAFGGPLSDTYYDTGII
jgi:hypothetical protein